MAKTIKTQIGLRRDTEANYELVKDTLIPVKGEVCMVDTDKGLKFKIGDGTSTFAQLDFIEPTTSGAGGTNVEANPELTGNEEKLNSITIDGTNYDIPSGAEAYVEEHQTLVINNNGTGGSSNNNLFQRRLDQPIAEWNSETSSESLVIWLEEQFSNMYDGQIVKINLNNIETYYGYGIVDGIAPDLKSCSILPYTFHIDDGTGEIVTYIYISGDSNLITISGHEGASTRLTLQNVNEFKLF